MCHQTSDQDQERKEHVPVGKTHTQVTTIHGEKHCKQKDPIGHPVSNSSAQTSRRPGNTRARDAPCDNARRCTARLAEARKKKKPAGLPGKKKLQPREASSPSKQKQAKGIVPVSGGGRQAWGSWRRGCGRSPSAPSSPGSPSGGRRRPLPTSPPPPPLRRLPTATQASRSSPRSQTPSCPAAPGTRFPMPQIPSRWGLVGIASLIQLINSSSRRLHEFAVHVWWFGVLTQLHRIKPVRLHRNWRSLCA